MKKYGFFPFLSSSSFNFYFKHKFVRTNSGYFWSFCFCLFSLYFLLCFLFIVLNLYKANKRVCIVFFSYSNGKIVSFALFCYYFPFKFIDYLEKILHLIWNMYVSVWRLIWFLFFRSNCFLLISNRRISIRWVTYTVVQNDQEKNITPKWNYKGEIASLLLLMMFAVILLLLLKQRSYFFNFFLQ